jgi:predicted dehydrogenase
LTAGPRFNVRQPIDNPVNPAKQPVRLGIVGAGYVVESYHLPVLRSLRQVDLRWICDQDAGRARRLAAAAGIPRAAGAVEECSDVDMVLVAIPVGARRGVMEKVLARGWHAFCEKPFAPTLADHEWIVAEARRRAVRLGVGLVRRFYESTQTAQRLIYAQVLGPVREILAGEGAWMRRTGRGPDWYQASAQASGGGTLFETGSHLVDQTFTVCGVEGYQISRCAQKSSDGLEFETSVQGEVELQRGRTAPFAFVVTRLDDVYNGIVVRCQQGELRVSVAPDGLAAIAGRDGRMVGRVGTPSSPQSAVLSAVRAEWQAFISACGRSAEFSDWDTGILTTSFIEECYRFDTRYLPRPALETAR